MSDLIPSPVLLAILQNQINKAVDKINKDLDKWISVSSTDVQLDSRFNVDYWEMEYNDKLKLLWFVVRLNPTETISGQIRKLFVLPRNVKEGALVNSDSGRDCFFHEEGLFVQGPNKTWTQNTNYRFSALLKIE